MVIISIATMGIMAFLFAALLAFADHKLKVVIDPRIEAINAILPQANCGACGYPGCMGYATALVEQDVATNGCAAGGPAAAGQIATILGKSSGPTEKRVARVHCRGDEAATARKAPYRGIATCRAANLVGGGDKVCAFGCLGYGDCTTVCPFAAIRMGDHGLPEVDASTCTGCGLCVKACPKGILELHPENQPVLVFCRSHDNPKVSRATCKNACLGCGICVRACGSTGAIELDHDLAVVRNAAAIGPECLSGLAKCPTKAIGSVPPPGLPPS